MAQYRGTLKHFIPVVTALWLLLVSASVLSRDLVVYSTEGPLNQYVSLMKSRPNLIDDNKPILLQQSQRAVAEIYIFQQAVASSNLGLSIKLKPESANMRHAFTLAQAGRVITFTETYSHVDIVDKRDDFYISQAVLNKGEYPVGLYTSIDNHRALATERNQLHKLSAASHPQWHTDWSILESINVKNIHAVNSMEAALNLVGQQKADIVLKAFQSGEGFVFSHNNHKLVPIVGLKVFFPDSRHFLISKKHPDGDKVFQALEIGLTNMRQSGAIKKIYQRFGVMDERVADWQVVNKEQ